MIIVTLELNPAEQVHYDKFGSELRIMGIDISALQSEIETENGKIVAVRFFEVELPSLPVSISNFDNLEIIEIKNKKRNKPLSIFNEDTIDTLSLLNNLKELYITGTEVESIPTNIGQISTLRVLKLSHNAITAVPVSIQELQSLEELYLESNNLTELPDSIGNLSTLKRLNLEYNSLSSLPETIGNLHALEFLWLQDNELNKLPATFANLTSLKFIDLSSNSLVEIPGITQMNQLRVLKCSHNNIVSFPDIHSPHLRDLVLVNNSLMKPPHITSSNLETISIQNNKIRKLENFIHTTSNLKTINLRHNPVEYIDHQFLHELSVDTVNLEFVRLQYLSKEVFDTAEIGTLKIHGLKTNQLDSNIFECDIDTIEVILTDFTLPYLYDLYLHSVSKSDNKKVAELSQDQFSEIVLDQDKLDSFNTTSRLNITTKLSKFHKEGVTITKYEVEYQGIMGAGNMKFGYYRMTNQSFFGPYLVLPGNCFYLETNIKQPGPQIIRLTLTNYAHRNFLKRLRILKENKASKTYTDITTRIDPTGGVLECEAAGIHQIRLGYCYRDQQDYPEITYESNTENQVNLLQHGPKIYGIIH